MNIKLLNLLNKNARTSTADLATMLGVSEEEVALQIAEMEKEGLRAWLYYVRNNPGVYRLIWETLFIDQKAFDDYYKNFAASYAHSLTHSNEGFRDSAFYDFQKDEEKKKEFIVELDRKACLKLYDQYKNIQDKTHY